MRNLSDIVEAVKRDQPATEEELRYGLLAYVSLYHMDHGTLRDVLTKEEETPKFIKKMKFENSFNAYRAALSKSPKEWLGPNNDPKNPEYQRRLDIGIKLVKKATGIDLNEPTVVEPEGETKE